MNALELLEEARQVAPASPASVERARHGIIVAASQSDGRSGVWLHAYESHRGISAAAAAALVATGGLTAWAVTRPTNPHTNTTIECGYDTYIPVESGDPLVDCHNALARQERPVPRLDGWITPTGLVAVLPASDRPPAGSVPLPAGFREDGSVLYLDDITNDVAVPTATACTSASQATAFATKELGVAGLAGWSVEVRSGASSCSIYIGLTDASTKTLTLVPESYSASPNVTVSLDERLRQQLGTSAGARCVAPGEAASLVRRDARDLGIDPPTVIVSQGGPVGTGSPKCSIATLDPAGGIEVTIWMVAAASR